jgi:hypothetical protein
MKLKNLNGQAVVFDGDVEALNAQFDTDYTGFIISRRPDGREKLYGFNGVMLDETDAYIVAQSATGGNLLLDGYVRGL